ncbi:hypothetical protein H0H93_006218 [Arthromyces matolae]|nr:hypothetical protein H0H93_006218 [Arthromyces matolae]
MKVTVGASVQDALRNPPNPRAPGPAPPPLARPSELPVENNDTASRIIHSMQQASQSVKSNVPDPRLVQRGNLHGAALAMKLPNAEVGKPSVKAPSHIHIKITSVFNKKATKSKRDIGFDPYTLSKPRQVLFSAVQDEIRTVLDLFLFKEYDLRIQQIPDFQLRYAHSQSQLDPEDFGMNLGDLWTSHLTRPHISSKARKDHVIELIVDVSFKPKAKNSSTPSPKKRKKYISDGSESDDEPVGSKRQQTYLTTIEEEETQYYVSRSDCEIQDAAVRWKTQPEQLLVSVMEDSMIASGTTKRVYKLFIEDQAYAAKRFFNTGSNRALTNDELKRHGRQELLRQAKAQMCLSEFTKALKLNKVSSADLRVSPGFLLTVQTGPLLGQTWIVDPLLSNTQTYKYSGTLGAGRNTEDLFGKTCDAFAHFSVVQSNGILNIRIGIKEPKKTGSVRGVDDLVLFDLMVHSLDKSGGLGDRGAAGIQDFGAEHVCNTICKSLKLPKLASVIRLPKNNEPLSPPIYVQIGRGFQPAPGDESFEDIDSLQPPSGGVDTSKNEKVLQFGNESFEWGPFKVHPATLSRSEKEDDAQKILVLSLHALKLSPGDADGHSHSEVMRYVAASSIAGDFFEDLEKSTDTDADYACFEIVSLRIALRCASNLVQIPKSKIADLNAWTFIYDFRDNDSGALGSGVTKLRDLG